MKIISKSLSAFLVVLLILSVFGTTAFADSGGNTSLTTTVPCTVTLQVGDHGKVTVDGTDYTGSASFQKDAGTVVTHTFSPNTLYVVDKVIYNGVEVTSELSGNTYTAPALTGNAALSVSFRFISGGGSGSGSGSGTGSNPGSGTGGGSGTDNNGGSNSGNNGNNDTNSNTGVATSGVAQGALQQRSEGSVLGAQETNARGGQTGDNFKVHYHLLMMFSALGAAFLLLRMENPIEEFAGTKKRPQGKRKTHRTRNSNMHRKKRAHSGLEFISFDVTAPVSEFTVKDRRTVRRAAKNRNVR